MADGQGYPYGDVVRALEQTGWLKSEIERKADKEDLARLEGILKDFARRENERQLEKWKSSLNDWWRFEQLQLKGLLADAIKTDREEQEAVRIKVLEEQGMEIGPDGRPKSKVNPVRSFLARHWAIPVVIIAFIAIAKPAWIGAGISFIRMFS